MVISDRRVKKTPKPITLNDVPVGQVFQGTLIGYHSGTRVSGTFYKANGPWTDVDTTGTTRIVNDTVVVRLDAAGMFNGHSNIWTYCVAVENYEPLDVELVIKG